MDPNKSENVSMSIYQEKYGFVYIWYDRKRNMYYVGSHWGTENDGYICSSNWMYNTYRRRPQDFKRKILKRIYTNRKDLLDEEQKWLSMIKEEEVATRNTTDNPHKNVRYYNLNRSINAPWWSTEDGVLTVGEKISKSNKGKNTGPREPHVGENISKSKKQKFAEREAEQGYKFHPEHRKKLSESRTGYTHTEEWKLENGRRMKEQWDSGVRKKAGPKPKKMTIEEQAQQSSDRLKTNWSNPEWKARQQERLKEGAKSRPPKSKESRDRSRELQKGIPKPANARTYRIIFTDQTEHTIKGLVKYSKESKIPLSSLSGAANTGCRIHKYRIQSVTRLD